MVFISAEPASRRDSAMKPASASARVRLAEQVLAPGRVTAQMVDREIRHDAKEPRASPGVVGRGFLLQRAPRPPCTSSAISLAHDHAGRERHRARRFAWNAAAISVAASDLRQNQVRAPWRSPWRLLLHVVVRAGHDERPPAREQRPRNGRAPSPGTVAVAYQTISAGTSRRRLRKPLDLSRNTCSTGSPRQHVRTARPRQRVERAAVPSETQCGRACCVASPPGSEFTNTLKCGSKPAGALPDAGEPHEMGIVVHRPGERVEHDHPRIRSGCRTGTYTPSDHPRSRRQAKRWASTSA